MTALGLPEQVAGCLFDLDGVLTQTAKLYSAARRQFFHGADVGVSDLAEFRSR
jgi:beta-phosphoglucomutase-like phosphatase (HAD superfamily)